jgi:GNAT superfamily N-acetyltransferase
MFDMLGRMDAVARGRATDFVTALDDACAETVTACPGGHALLDTRHSALWSANHLRVETPDPPAAAGLDEAAGGLFDALGFRMITVLDEPAGRLLSEPLAALGYAAAHELLMIGGPQTASAERSDAVVDVTHEDLEASRQAAQVEQGRDAQIGRQLATRDALIGTVVDVRRLAILIDGEVAARCQIHSGGGVAQIENLYITPAHRGRGLSRVLAESAVYEARAAGAELLFGIADAADWPQAFYRRLGFTDAGLLPRFLRTGPA